VIPAGRQPCRHQDHRDPDPRRDPSRARHCGG
jgi:hypothetical protein